uniref:Uncharacterized protein n=1 Tax=Arundo donax TaxID=35708 RepID=A0A0A9HJN2_ARUDO
MNLRKASTTSYRYSQVKKTKVVCHQKKAFVLTWRMIYGMDLKLFRMQECIESYVLLLHNIAIFYLDSRNAETYL